MVAQLLQLKLAPEHVGCISVAPVLMTRTIPELSAVTDALWFCLLTQPKHEHIAAASLRRHMKVPAFAPRLRFRKATRRGSVWFVEAMFPGYIFAQFVYAESHRQVRSQPGIRNILQFGDHVALIEDATIAALKEKAGEEETLTIDVILKVGQSVQITEGPLRGLEAVVTQVVPARERIRVLLEFLGGQIQAEVPAPGVLPIGGARS